MISEEDRVVWDTIIESLQNPAFRAWRIATYGRNIDCPNGCVAEIQDDGALLCMACPAQMFGEDEIEWMH